MRREHEEELSLSGYLKMRKMWMFFFSAVALCRVIENVMSKSG